MSLGTAGGGLRRRPLRARTALSSLALLLSAWLVGCDLGDSSTLPGPVLEGSGGGGSGAAGSAGLGPVITLTPLELPCQVPDTGAPVFAGRGVSSRAPARRVLYTWTTPEQVQEIRRGSVLLTRTERAELGPGFAMNALAEIGARAPYPDGTQPSELEQLAKVLSGPLFSKARYAWSEPWATLMGWPGETYGNQLVRIVLKADAWLARFRGEQLDVVDMNNLPVPTADVLAHPERLAAIYYVREGRQDGGPDCGGSFRMGSNGYREFIVGNEAMIEEWSHGTPEILARLDADRALLTEFFQRVRPCPPQGDVTSWNLDVVCGWSGEVTSNEMAAYADALAIPSARYLPQALPLVTLLETLEAARFEPDPFVVKPSQ